MILQINCFILLPAMSKSFSFSIFLSTFGIVGLFKFWFIFGYFLVYFLGFSSKDSGRCLLPSTTGSSGSGTGVWERGLEMSA